MNILNERRSKEVNDQLFSFEPGDATPTANFVIDPEYTLIARLPRDVSDSIARFANELQHRFPEHYYYSPEQYHLTLVPIPHDIEPARAIELLTPVLNKWHLPIAAHGLACNRFQASAVLYPGEETLIPQRMKLRSVLGIPEQAFTIHRPIWEELLWVNFMRFTVKPETELLAFLREHAKTEIGRFVLGKYELYEVSTKTLDPASSTLLHTFNA